MKHLIVRVFAALLSACAGYASAQIDNPVFVGAGAVVRTVKDYGAKCDGSTDDSAAIQAAITAMPASGGNLVFPPCVYLVNVAAVHGLSVTGKSHFVISGYGATIKVRNAEPIRGNHGVLWFQSSTDGVIQGLTVDGNRANRGKLPIPEVGASNIYIANSSARLHFENVNSNNSVTDGLQVITTGIEGTQPKDITLVNFNANANARNGIQISSSIRFKMIGGKLSNSAGYASAGISYSGGINLEPDIGGIGNTDAILDGVTAQGNAGHAFQVGGSDPTLTGTVTLRNLVSVANGTTNSGSALTIGAGTVYVSNFSVSGHTVAERGLIDIQSPNARLIVDGVTFVNNRLSGKSNALIYIHSATRNRTYLRNVRASNSAAPVISAWAPVTIDGVTATTVPDAAIQIQGVAAIGSILENAVIENSAGRAIYIASPNVDVNNVTLRNCASTTASIQFSTGATGASFRNSAIHQSTAIPRGAVGAYFNEVPGVVSNIVMRSAGTDYTAATSFIFFAGVVGAKLQNLRPHPFSK